MSAPDALHQTFAVVWLAMAFSAFILFVRGHRPSGVSGLWYDLALGFIALWLGLWPEVIGFAGEPDLVNGLGLLLQIIATVAGCLLGALLAKALRLMLLERRRPRPPRAKQKTNARPRL